ncbi:hypothetical protein GCM10010302_75870 [Streptomyces polychromogenes]|uniref:Uncharacterized protein n=1 Tax=Streptomyces polychromogenes TaxID=67342 RepID=A0ABN0W571_9ACTN
MPSHAIGNASGRTRSCGVPGGQASHQLPDTFPADGLQQPADLRSGRVKAIVASLPLRPAR